MTMNKGEIKKLVFITARLPYPATSGRKNVMYNYCKILHEVYHYEITVVSFLEDGDKVDPKPSFINNVIVLPNVRTRRKFVNLVKDTFILEKVPMQVSLYYDPDCEKEISEILHYQKPDLVIADMVRTTEYARKYEGYKIADLDDMISIRYERQLTMKMEDINPYGSYLYSLPKFIQFFLSLNFMKKFILSSEIKLLKQYERDISKVYDKTVFVADHEADILNEELHFGKAIGIPLGVDVDYFGELYGKIEPNAHTIGFLGAMNVAHNEAGVIHFVKDIMPLILKQVPDAKFVVVGGGVTDNLKAIANDKVVFTGRVKDVRAVVGACQVFVCPLTFGSGIKTKNLEAMAMGVPVVTTTIGAENINADDGKEWLVADTNQNFANQVVRLMTNEELHNEVMKNASEFVARNFTWKVAEERFKEIV